MYALTLTAELAGVTNLRPKDTQESNFFYTFKVQCTSCREVHPKPIAVNRFRESSATINAAPSPYQQTEPAKAQKILEFDCRGLEFTEFLPEVQNWNGAHSLQVHQHISTANMATNKVVSGDMASAISFLNDAAHLMATTSPESSAYLMSQRSDLLFEHELTLSDKQRQHVCSCCGHIMCFGQGDDLQVKSEKRASQNPRSARRLNGRGNPPRPQLQARPGPVKTITCGFCGRLTNIQLPAPSPIHQRRVNAEKITRASERGVAKAGMPSTAQEVVFQKTASNASSKKRAKSRKAGLQALLSQSSTSRDSNAGLGLSLADFLQK
ncbi:putative UPF0587 protein [Corynascus novoguineensis]|uniref:UPF0587 protein n=1 Tax=Corynascus novoguineensis TaxID=1126955 RepID=A0AAN7CXW1_9PEZI|nr:putative UPF0587 protein [Corynascus novoguineensis]